ncbi:MAG: PQQ-dependent sugar dehydrogenase [Actinomycetia bacterium]|nr:PQQ-dependent sugar dehydrogenase [Actinomycetes bacterium]
MERVGYVGLVALALVVVGCTSNVADTTTTTAQSALTTSTASVLVSTTQVTEASTTSEVAQTTVPLSELQIMLTEVDSGFESPVLLVADPAGGTDYVVEQPGRIVRADGQSEGGGHAVALDIRGSVKFAGEQGLLGLAFHPEFDQNGLAFVNYVDTSGQTVISQFVVSNGVFDQGSEVRILAVDQPAENHNGGMIAFGPEGFLWIGMGDGGAADDVFENGQNFQTLLGSMLRISVPGSNDAPYDVPELNPYRNGVDGAPEVYWTGLRNPWRFAFDPIAGDTAGADVWIADVGQGKIEEISVLRTDDGAANLGWPVMEGSECFRDDECDKDPFVLPVSEYGHEDGCSITGGYVYRGRAIPELDGHFFYSDFCSGFIRSYSLETGDHDWTPMTGSVSGVSGFGIGGDGELYVVLLGGTVYRVERASGE